MRAYSALSHLYHNEFCIATMADGSEKEVRWDKERWCFLYLSTAEHVACSFDEIEGWWPVSVKF